jgi:hypothetical protein
MKRLFTFGCSFTQYHWPTWADILGQQFDEFQNWGLNGSGNYCIFNSLNECILRNNITEDDTVIIMWTNIMREDRYINNKWVTLGNIYTQQPSNTNKAIIKYLLDERGYLLRDLSFIHSSKKLLENIGAKHIFLSMVPINNTDQYSISITDNNDIIKLYNNTINSIRPSVYETIFNFNWYSRPFPPVNLTNHNKLCQEIYTSLAGSDWPSFNNFINKNFQGITQNIITEISTVLSDISDKLRMDLHPTPVEHLQYIETVMPEFIISNSTIQWTNLIDNLVRAEQTLSNIWQTNLPNRF